MPTKTVRRMAFERCLSLAAKFDSIAEEVKTTTNVLGYYNVLETLIYGEQKKAGCACLPAEEDAKLERSLEVSNVN
ncbi:hypothetical protein EVAR_37177_1 [Eumeta japonica]|uniref:Uncharacterized protein n=1 Tax=Eumeta variegata TaxID=151549 RepID=A0A4C1WL41_EUMVA|nr:hypothetical protein EVAR_37177_1 [Eumeta japonica]